MPSVVNILIAPADSFVSEPVDLARLVFGGFEGDLHAGQTRPSCSRVPWHPRKTTIANTRQISILSAEECAAIAASLDLPELDPRLLGANLVIEGIPDLSALPAATRLQFPSGATLFIAEENMPCRRAGAALARGYSQPGLAAAFPKAAIGRRGLVAFVEREGELKCGDEVTMIIPRPRHAAPAAGFSLAPQPAPGRSSVPSSHIIRGD